MIEAQHLTKRYVKTVAVDEISFVVHPGRMTAQSTHQIQLNGRLG